MADYISKYTGEQIDEAIGKALAGSGGAVDKTLTVEGAAADAKTVGERLEELKEELNNVGLEIVRLY